MLVSPHQKNQSLQKQTYEALLNLGIYNIILDSFGTHYPRSSYVFCVGLREFHFLPKFRQYDIVDGFVCHLKTQLPADPAYLLTKDHQNLGGQYIHFLPPLYLSFVQN